MFEPFPQLTRFSHDWAVTEKIDGTNASVVIAPVTPDNADTVLDTLGPIGIWACSRSRLLGTTKEADNYGFAKWVQRNAEDLFALGEGRHFGEWCGNGIQRGYSLAEKTLALFDTHRWALNPNRPSCVTTVPVLAEGYLGNPAAEFDTILSRLRDEGSVFAPGFASPEGIVMLHRPSRTLFKKTFDYDEAGKWAENQKRKAA
jgi:hypothetical protein